MADINDYLDGLNYKLSAEEKQLMDILAECWEHCNKGDCHNCEYRSGNEWCKMLLCMSYQYAKRLIAAGYSKRLLPAADVVPVVRGKWLNIDGDYTFASCSICSEDYEVATEEEAEKGLWGAFLSAYRYCPNCGAKMGDEVKGDG